MQARVLAEVCRCTDAELGPVERVVKLLRNKGTVPFIARYRKDVTGGMGEEKLWEIEKVLQNVEGTEKLREKALNEAPEHLKQDLLHAATEVDIKELIKLYKTPKTSARMRAVSQGGEKHLDNFLNGIQPPKEGRDVLKVMLIDKLFHSPDLRKYYATAYEAGTLSTSLVSLESFSPKDKETLQKFSNFQTPVRRVANHTVQAIQRGCSTGKIKKKITPATLSLEHEMKKQIKTITRETHQVLADCLSEVHTKLDRHTKDKVWKQLLLRAEQSAIKVFGRNVKMIITKEPVKGGVVLALDPGYKHGTKCAVVSPLGVPLTTFTIYPLPPAKKMDEAIKVISRNVRDYHVTHIAVGDGCGGRDVENLILHLKLAPKVIRISECGASVYSASELARKELPSYDITHRSAIFLARALIDPLSERVKVDPIHLGVGQYQHDINKKELSSELEATCMSVIGSFGVDLNTASKHTLRYIPGINAAIAERLVEKREAMGGFKSREQIKKVKGVGPKTFEQCAGFLRVYNGDDVWDATAIHPESYGLVERLLKAVGMKHDAEGLKEAVGEYLNKMEREKVMEELNSGWYTLDCIVEEINCRLRDPRAAHTVPLQFREYVAPGSVVTGSVVTGIVTNITDWGSFVDVGLSNDGLMRATHVDIGHHVKVKIEKITPAGKIQLCLVEAQSSRKRKFDDV
eukprot:TRINITY_DN9346_c0_g1_i1.p1 TRINITY_DN9346_c0_g1~~TRINITY_DN9346_c0_g1_i1.p1  ORF type:complete len:688 (+),score=147.36 TRINITY_DN9346_c0_g1_i1:1535-3598(+)